MRAIGYWPVAGGAGLELLNVEYGIEDYAIVRWSFAPDKPKAYAINHHDEEGRPFITVQDERYYLDECLRAV